jgi:hypothetical protein
MARANCRWSTTASVRSSNGHFLDLLSPQANGIADADFLKMAHMLYLFPYENVFVAIISLVIAGALLFRWYLVRGRKK